MKEIIILFSTIILGIAIAGFVIGLQDSAKTITDKSANMIESLDLTGSAIK